METTKIALFKGMRIRKTLYQDEWWFVINDVIEALTNSTDPAQYFKRMKQRDQELAELINQGGVQFVPPPSDFYYAGRKIHNRNSSSRKIRRCAKIETRC